MMSQPLSDEVAQGADASESPAPEQRGRLWHLQNNLKTRLAGGGRATLKSRWFYLVVVLLVVATFVGRASLQPLFLSIRAYTFVVVYVLGLALLAFTLFKLKVRPLVTWPVLICLLGVAALLLQGGQRYLALYLKHRTLDKVALSQLPLTDNDVPQPLKSIHVLACETIGETDAVSLPDRVLVDGEVRWVMEITSAFFSGKVFSRVEELYNVSATAPSPDFSKRETVDFDTGEGLLFSKNAYTAVIKRLGPLDYFSSYPAEVRYFKDTQGQWVQVVSMARWKGLLFPTIEFDGVYVIRQSPGGGMGRWLKRVLLGEGGHIGPRDIHKHAYLSGQNLMPDEVSRDIAMSFRFQAGFFGPMPGLRHEGDIRIPDLAEDMNPQPFTVYFKDLQKTKGLFHYFGLEPYMKDRHGLNTSLFIPGDGGKGKVYYYAHVAAEERLTGASAIPPKIIESRKNYDWSKSRAVESRPYIKDIAGKRRFYWLCTIATVNADGHMAGTMPDLVVTDARYPQPVWVSTGRGSDHWNEQIDKEMAHTYSKE